MSFVPSSQLSLARKRRQLTAMIESGHWNDLLDLESELFSEIDTAVEDPQRSSRDLLNELGNVIRVYRELSNLCSNYGQNNQIPKA